jgi:hypothetical protein
MTGDPTNPEPNTNHSTLTFPAESEYASGHDMAFWSTEALDRRTFDEMERLGQRPYRGGQP